MHIDLRADLMLNEGCFLIPLQTQPSGATTIQGSSLIFADVAMTSGKASICIKSESDAAQLPSCHILHGAVGRPS